MVRAERVGGRLEGVRGFNGGFYAPDLHANRIDALASATLGVMAVAMIGQAPAQARGLVTNI